MATTFDIHSFTLELASNYRELRVIKALGGEVAARYDLQKEGQVLSICVHDDDYELDYTTCVDGEEHGLDVGAGSSLTILRTTMDGIGIVDIRDMRVGGPFDITYDLACCTFQLRYIQGPFALRVHFEKKGCATKHHA